MAVAGGDGEWNREGPPGVLRPVPHLSFHPRRVLQMLRENLEEEAIIMKDVPDWKVGPGQGGQGCGPPQKHSPPREA